MKKVALIVILLFSVLNIAAAMAQCPTCRGTGEIVCPQCNGTASVVKPSISNQGSQAWTNDEGVLVVGNFQNNEDIGVYGTLIATITRQNRTYTSSSSRTYFPPHETIKVSITIEGIEDNDYQYFSSIQYPLGYMSVSEVDGNICSYCDGTGFVICPECGGALIDGEGSEQTNGGALIDGGGREQKKVVPVSSPVDWTLVGVGAIATVAIVAVVVVKRKKVTEKDLRRLTPTEFQKWVVQRLSGKTSSIRDSRIGIDAYTSEGHPIQIRQSDDIGRNVIENFASVMGRIKAKNGIIIAFSFADDAIRGIVRARITYRVEIKKVTIKELIERREII